MRIDPTLDYGCFIFAQYEDDAFFRLGINRVEDNVYFMVADISWRSLEEGKTYDIEIEFDNEGPWEVPATGMKLGGEFVVLGGRTSRTLFVQEFMKRHVMYIRYRGKTILSLRLKGSYAAVMEMLECQEQIDAYKNYDEDPFSGQKPDPGVEDPFAHEL